MKVKFRNFTSALVCLCLFMFVAVLADAQSPFSADNRPRVGLSQTESGHTPSKQLPSIDQIGWVRSDMGTVSNKIVQISRATVNVRSGPSTRFSILQTTSRGDSYPFVREQGGWYAMKIGNVDFDSMPQAWIRNDMCVVVGNVVGIIRDKVNLRNGPSTKYAVTGTTMVGKTYPLLGGENGWSRIALMSADNFIPRSKPVELKAAQQNFMVSYGLYTRLVTKKGLNNAQTQSALNDFREKYGIYRILAKGSEALQQARANQSFDKIVINKANFTSTLYSNGKVVRIYPIAYGANPDGENKQYVGDRRTPEGAFEVLNKAVNPAYKNIPGGAANNPFGTRWMGLNTWRGSIGMHGTSAPSSIGSRASAGCVRMFTPDAEELYDMVRVGMPVMITSATMPPAEPEPEPEPEPVVETDSVSDSVEDSQLNGPVVPSEPVEQDPPPKKGFWNSIKSFFRGLFS